MPKRTNKNNTNTNLLLYSTLIITIFAVTTFFLFLPIQNTYAHHILEEIPVTERPMKISLDDPLLFVSNLGQPVISIISTVSDNVAGTIETSSGVIDVEGILDKNKVYVATFQSGEIEVYDLTTKQLIKKIPIPNSIISFPPGLADRLLVTSTVVTGGWSIDYNPNNEMLYVANLNTEEISVIDTNNDTIVSTISVPGNPSELKVDPNTNKILVTSIARNELTFISGDTNNVTGKVKTGISPWGIAIDETKDLAYITNRGSYYITVVDINEQKVVGKIPIGEQAHSVSVDSNENKIYVSYDEDDKITKINGLNNEIETLIELDGRIGGDIVVDPNSHKLYTSLKYGNDILVLGPETISISLPVITMPPPVLEVGEIILHGQDVKPVNPILRNTVDSIYNLTSFAILNSENKSIAMQLVSQDGGNLQIKIPETILELLSEPETMTAENITDIKLTVLVDGEKTEYIETPLTIKPEKAEQQQEQAKEISVFIPKGDTTLEIIGKDIIP